MSANGKIPPIQRLEATIYGRVQMVMFRDFTVRQARALGLMGEVKNMPDGSVVVVAQGARSALQTLLHALHKGPMLAKVEHIEMRFTEPSGVYSGFHIVYE